MLVPISNRLRASSAEHCPSSSTLGSGVTSEIMVPMVVEALEGIQQHLII
jgi:hypothetical protein